MEIWRVCASSEVGRSEVELLSPRFAVPYRTAKNHWCPQGKGNFDSRGTCFARACNFLGAEAIVLLIRARYLSPNAHWKKPR